MDRNAEPVTLVRSLAQTLARAKAVGQLLSATQLRVSPVPKGWSPNEILWHIRATADVHGEHIARILDEDTPRWRHVSPRARMKKSRYDELPFAESLAAFAQQRTNLVARLKRIEPDEWQRVALVYVPYYHREWRLTLHTLVWGMSDHEEGHCEQMEQVATALSEPGELATAGRRKRR
jgi:hypothetical protein